MFLTHLCQGRAVWIYLELIGLTPWGNLGVLRPQLVRMSISVFDTR